MHSRAHYLTNSTARPYSSREESIPGHYQTRRSSRYDPDFHYQSPTYEILSSSYYGRGQNKSMGGEYNYDGRTAGYSPDYTPSSYSPPEKSYKPSLRRPSPVSRKTTNRVRFAADEPEPVEHFDGEDESTVNQIMDYLHDPDMRYRSSPARHSRPESVSPSRAGHARPMSAKVETMPSHRSSHSPPAPRDKYSPQERKRSGSGSSGTSGTSGTSSRSRSSSLASERTVTNEPVFEPKSSPKSAPGPAPATYVLAGMVFEPNQLPPNGYFCIDPKTGRIYHTNVPPQAPKLTRPSKHNKSFLDAFRKM